MPFIDRPAYDLQRDIAAFCEGQRFDRISEIPTRHGVIFYDTNHCEWGAVLAVANYEDRIGPNA